MHFPHFQGQDTHRKICDHRGAAGAFFVARNRIDHHPRRGRNIAGPFRHRDRYAGRRHPRRQADTDQPANQRDQLRNSNDVGVYNFNALPPARSSSTWKRKDFRPKSWTTVNDHPGTAERVDVKLEVGQVAQTVTVDASQAPLLDSDTATIGGTISENQIQHMPSFGRDVFQLDALAPGTTGDARRQRAEEHQPSGHRKGPGAPGQMRVFSRPKTARRRSPMAASTRTTASTSMASAPRAWCGAGLRSLRRRKIRSIMCALFPTVTMRRTAASAERRFKSPPRAGQTTFHGSAFFQAYRPGLNAYQRYNGPGSFFNPEAPRACKPWTRCNEPAAVQPDGRQHRRPFWKDQPVCIFLL